MTDYRYHSPKGGLPPQDAPLEDRAVFTQSYAFLPAVTMSDITTSYLPFWDNTRLWIIARPLSGFAETFSHYLMDVAAGGGSERPDDDASAQSVIFVVSGSGQITIDGTEHTLGEGGYAYVPAGSDWTFFNKGDASCCFHWVRKRYEAVEGLDHPIAFVTSDAATAPIFMPDTDGKWATTRFVDPADLRHDMHVNIVTFEEGGLIPFPETHVMEHGLFVLEGEADYLLNKDWVKVEEGDYMWLRAFCPQACHVGSSGRFRYLLYKDVNRHAKLGSFLR